MLHAVFPCEFDVADVFEMESVTPKIFPICFEMYFIYIYFVIQSTFKYFYYDYTKQKAYGHYALSSTFIARSFNSNASHK